MGIYTESILLGTKKMKISLNWLKEFIDIEESPEDLSDILTAIGLEVEGLSVYEPVPGGLKGLLIGQVIACEQHPNADRLKLTKVDVGNGEILSIICGAPNVSAGQKVVIARINSTLYPKEAKPFKIKKSKIRGELSQGMICAEDEIGLGSSHEGIVVLDTDLPNGTPAAQCFSISNDYVFEIGLTPNRADAASHYGIARDLKWTLKKTTKFPDISAFKLDTADRPIAVHVANPEACPRYAGVTISGITVAPSPSWLQHRLKTIGLSPINNVVDATNYVLHSLGQPLHAFDADEIKGEKIIVRNASEGEPFITLDEVERKLSRNDLMICDAVKPMCMGGIFGGIKSGVSQKTTAIFLESAYFSPTYIRRSALYHGLKTDAAFRFERGVDPNGCVQALKVATSLIQEIAGGKVCSEIIDIYPQPMANFQLQLRYKNIDRLIGRVIPKEEIKAILTSLEIDILQENQMSLKLSVPTYRVDVQREADVIEEILRTYGYDNITVPQHLTLSYLSELPKFAPEKVRIEISEMLAASNLQEIMTNSLIKASYPYAGAKIDDTKSIYMLNALSADFNVMRQTMLFSGLEVIAYNINRKQKDLQLFEFGKTYHKEKKSYTEKELLALFFTGNIYRESWQRKSQPTDLYYMGGIIQKIFTRFGIKNYIRKSIQNAPFSQGLTYSIDNRTLCQMGLVQPSIAQSVDVKQAVFFASIDWQQLLAKLNTGLSYEEIPKFPEVRRDLSLVMDKHLTFEEIKYLAYETEKKLLKNTNVFDIYEGKNIGVDKKSYSVSFILQDQHKTLNDKLIDSAMNRLIKAFEDKFNILIRK